MTDRSKFKLTTLLHHAKDLFNEEIAYFQRYVIDVSGQFEKNAEQLNRDFMPAEHDFNDAWYKEAQVQEAFPKILNGSILITIQTVLEKNLKSLMDSGVRVFGLCPREKRPNESEIGYAKSVFETEFGFNFHGVAVSCVKIDGYREVRNVFVHHGGNLKGVAQAAKKAKILRLIEQDERLVYNEHTGDIIIFDNQYLISYLQQVQLFCGSGFDQLIVKHNAFIRSNGGDHAA